MPQRRLRTASTRSRARSVTCNEWSLGLSQGPERSGPQPSWETTPQQQSYTATQDRSPATPHGSHVVQEAFIVVVLVAVEEGHDPRARWGVRKSRRRPVGERGGTTAGRHAAAGRTLSVKNRINSGGGVLDIDEGLQLDDRRNAPVRVAGKAHLRAWIVGAAVEFGQPVTQGRGPRQEEILIVQAPCIIFLLPHQPRLKIGNGPVPIVYEPDRCAPAHVERALSG